MATILYQNEAPSVTCRTAAPGSAAWGNHLFRGLGREVEGLKGSHTLLRRFRRACNTKQERGGKELSFLVLSSSRPHGERTKAMQAGRTYLEDPATPFVGHGVTTTSTACVIALVSHVPLAAV